MSEPFNGPWVTREEYTGTEVGLWSVHVSGGAVRDRHARVAFIDTTVRPGAAKATAELIAAAPDLRDLLERTMEVCGKYQCDDEVDGLLDVIQHFLIRLGVSSKRSQRAALEDLPF